jgi:GxxExxY protein
MNEKQIGQIILAHELKKRGLSVRRQVPIPIEYDGLTFDEGFRADLIVHDLVILELKSVAQVSPAHRKQIQTYLRLAGHKFGYLVGPARRVAPGKAARTRRSPNFFQPPDRTFAAFASFARHSLTPV